jgi:tetratricopeptide (TPR) repeat protein
MDSAVRYTIAACLLAAAAGAQSPANSAASPGGFSAQIRAGIQLDLQAHYGEARQDFAKAIAAATTAEEKERALRSMAVSWAFEGNCKEAAKYDGKVYDTALAGQQFFEAGQVADELARICIDGGDLDSANDWYQKGRDAGMREPNLKPDRKDLWEFRWEHAQARIAARRGQADEARKHVAAARKILDRGTNPTQAQFLPYLAGYVAFYAGEYKIALAELQNANQKDPFILSLIAQSYEKLGDREQAMDTYRKVLEFDAHNPANASARPLARKKVG